MSRARQNIKNAQEVQRKEYDKRKGVGGIKFNVGDLVKKRNLKNDARQGGWSELHFSGPYEIVSIAGDHSCELKNVKTNHVLAARALPRNLRPWHERPDAVNEDKFGKSGKVGTRSLNTFNHKKLKNKCFMVSFSRRQA